MSSGTITADNAEAIERYYELADSRSSNFGFVVLAAVGSALIGAGIVLLIAHNWDELSRVTRSIIAFLPLIGAQALVVFVLLRRNESRPWREAVAVFDVAAVATAISLISQTYQIQGTFAAFMSTWLLLSIPIVYLLRATLGAAVYVVGTIVWLFAREGFFGRAANPNLFWLLLLLVVPYVVVCFRRDRTTRETGTLSVLLALAMAIGLGFTAEFARSNLGGVAFAGLFATVYLCGMRWFPQSGARLHPLALLGGIAIGVTAIVLGFEDLWHMRGGIDWAQHSRAEVVAVAIELLFPIVAIVLAAWEIAVRRGAQFSFAAAALPVVAGIAWAVANLCRPEQSWMSTRCSYAAAAIFIVYALVLGIELLIRGIRANSIPRANFGLLIIAALAIARFFDSELGFVTRGVGFIVVGAGFLIANMVLFKKRAHA